jgi:hypothetical protein
MRIRLRQIGSNQTELQVGGLRVLFSYETPVAGHIEGRGYFRTTEHYSTTTSRHINQYLGGLVYEELSQEEIDQLLEVKQ